MMAVHEGPGVLPGRYEGGPIRVHKGPTPQQLEHDAAKRAADVLAGRIGAAAALSAQFGANWLELRTLVGIAGDDVVEEGPSDFVTDFRRFR